MADGVCHLRLFRNPRFTETTIGSLNYIYALGREKDRPRPRRHYHITVVCTILQGIMRGKELPSVPLPVTKFIVSHPEGKRSRHDQCVHFVTYGLFHGPTGTRFPTVLTLDLSEHLPPPPDLCERFTGLDDEIVEAFFSTRANEDEFHSALRELRQKLKGWPRGGCVAALINCTAGKHRSVAMAERLAKELRSWDGFKAECAHLDLGKGMERQARNAARVGIIEMPEDTAARGRRRSRHEVQATSETRVSEKRSRGAAAIANTGRLSKEAPFDTKKISFGPTITMGEPHPQQRETVGRSAGSLRKIENESRRPWEEAPLRRTTVSYVTTGSVSEPHPQQRGTAGRSAGPWEKDENRRQRL